MRSRSPCWTPPRSRHLLALIREAGPKIACAALIALSSLAFPDVNKATLLAQPDILDLLVRTASHEPAAPRAHKSARRGSACARNSGPERNG